MRKLPCTWPTALARSMLCPVLEVYDQTWPAVKLMKATTVFCLQHMYISNGMCIVQCLHFRTLRAWHASNVYSSCLSVAYSRGGHMCPHMPHGGEQKLGRHVSIFPFFLHFDQSLTYFSVLTCLWVQGPPWLGVSQCISETCMQQYSFEAVQRQHDDLPLHMLKVSNSAELLTKALTHVEA